MKDQILDSIPEEITLGQPASFGSRLWAYFLDLLPIAVIANLAVYFIWGLNPLATEVQLIELENGLMISEGESARAISRSIALIVWLLYSIVMDASSYQGTHGKISSRIKVVDVHGQSITLAKSCLRNGMKLISYLPLGLGFFWALWDPEKRTWHDKIADTYVVKKEN